MKAKIQITWGFIKSSFAFVPTIMSVAAVFTAYFFIYVDKLDNPTINDISSYVYNGGADGARTLLSTISGSMIGIAGVSFSITIVALTLASGQFGPRLLRNFMKDLGNQFVLGTYISTFIYCLFVIQAIRSTGDIEFIPRLSVAFAMVLAILGLGVLIFFFHYISTSIQADYVIADAYRDLGRAIDKSFPESVEISEGKKFTTNTQLTINDKSRKEVQQIKASKSGYIQAIDYEGLVAIAQKEDLIIEIDLMPGDYQMMGSVIMTIKTNKNNLDVSDKLNGCMIVGKQKTSDQDLEYSIDQLVEIAVRALSPGVNDPTTAITCIDHLSSALSVIALRQFPPNNYMDSDEQLRVIAKPFSFTGMFNTAFDQIRQNGNNTEAVCVRLLQVFEKLAPIMITKEQKDVIALHAKMVHSASEKNFSEYRDKEIIAELYRKVMQKLAANMY
ncbi:DUF2254 domain-containing protein [Fulvivirgaceae bacterium LMO-SS25]